MKCPKCNAENPEIAKFCHSCGNILEDIITYDNNPEEAESGERKTNIIKIISAIVSCVCLFFMLAVVYINGSTDFFKKNDIEEYGGYEEVESGEEDLFMESEKTITYSSDGYIEYQTMICYDIDGKIIEEADANDDSWETETIYEYDDYGRISEINLDPYSNYNVNINLDVYYEDEDGNFVSKGNFYDPEHYCYDVTCKYDNENRLLEFYIYKGGEIYTPDKGDKKIYAYEIRSYYDDGLIEYKESKIEDELIKLFYNEDGSLDKKMVSVRSNGPSSEYYYKRYKGIDIQVSAVDVDRVSTDWGYEDISTELHSDVEETENKIEITNFRENEVEGYITWEFDENGNKTKMSKYNADYELESETYYTWIDEFTYFNSYD